MDGIWLKDRKKLANGSKNHREERHTHTTIEFVKVSIRMQEERRVFVINSAKKLAMTWKNMIRTYI
jgi:hypothetical protein